MQAQTGGICPFFEIVSYPHSIPAKTAFKSIGLRFYLKA